MSAWAIAAMASEAFRASPLRRMVSGLAEALEAASTRGGTEGGEEDCPSSVKLLAMVQFIDRTT